MEISRIRPISAGVVRAFVILAFGSLPGYVQAVDYQFTPLITAPGVRINAFNPQRATINNSGVVAYAIGPSSFLADLVLDDGSSVTTIDLNAATGFGGIDRLSAPFINDAGAVGFYARQASFGAPAPGKIIRINADLSLTTLATTNNDGVTGDLISVEGNIGMNNLGQVAAEVTFNTGETGMALIDDDGVLVVDTVTADRFTFIGASINDVGIVAYKAQESVPNSAGGSVSVFVGDGMSPAQIGLPLPPTCGNTSAEADINNNGLIAGQHPSCLFVGSGGVATETIVDPATNPFAESIGRLSLNDRDQVVFVTSTINNGSGLFFGDDPVNDKLIETGDMLFGEPVGNPTGIPFCCGPVLRFGGDGGFNDHGQVVFAVATVSESNVATSYLIRADRDTDSDGVMDNNDNCTEIANADQRDSNGDGIGNVCDADLDGNCVINFSDLGIMKSVFFTPDMDADLDGNGVVNFTDLGMMKAAFFGPPGPSATGPC